MKISYDSEADAVYIRLLEGKQECRAIRLNENVVLNLGLGEKLVGIEILGAQNCFGPSSFPGIASLKAGTGSAK